MDIMGGFPDDVRGLFALVGDTAPPQDPTVERPRVDQPPRGRSGRAHFSGFIQIDEPNRKWIGVEGLRLADQMWRSDGDMKRATLAVWGPIQSATYAWEPYGGESAGKKDKEAVEIIEWNLNEFMQPNFIEHLGELGPILIRSGYTDFEQIWKSVSQNGKQRVGVKKLDLRLPRTIWKFYQDEDGDLSGIVQFLPNSRNVWIPANDILHYRLQAEGDNWTGTSLYRHAYKHYYYKEKLEALDAIGQERKAVGVPVVFPPEGASEETKQEMEAILANLHTNEAGFIIMPGPKRQGTDGPNIGWDIEIITFDSSSGNGIKESIDQQTTKIAGAFMTDFLELGHHQVGARATAEVQEDPFLTAISALGEGNVVPPIQRLGARIAAMNIDGLQGFPKLRMIMHDEASLSEISTFVQQLIVAEAITPDPDLEDYLREHGNLPAANPDFRAEREAQRKRQVEDEEKESEAKSNQPNAGGGAPGKDGKETPSTGEQERGEGPQGTPEKEPTRSPSKKSLQLDAAASMPEGVMVALYPSEDVAQQLAVDGDGALSPDDLHITLAYLGKKSELSDPEALRNAVAKWAADTPPITAKAGGIGVFSPSNTSEGRPVTYVPVDAPKLTHHREGLVRRLKQAEQPIREDHGFTPHMTLAYADKRNTEPPALPMQFDHATLTMGGKQEHFPLAGKKPLVALDSPSPPPNLRDSADVAKRCGTCHMFNMGYCWGYRNLDVEPDWLCDSWEQSNMPQTFRLEAPSADDVGSAPWYERLLSQGKLSDALDNSRENMETATRPAALKLATMAALRARSGRKIRMAAPAELQKAIAAEFERLYTLGYRTVAEELLKQHQVTGTHAVLTLDAADGEATTTETEQPEEIVVTPGKRHRRVSRRAAIAAEHITGEATREAERQALGKRDALTQQRAVEAKVNGALHKEALSNASSIINEGRKDAALAAVAAFAAKSAVYGHGEGAEAIGGPELKLKGIYTAVLDGRTCDACSLADDGEEREPDDPALEVPNPLCAGTEYCRCTVVWVLVVPSQEISSQPALTV